MTRSHTLVMTLTLGAVLSLDATAFAHGGLFRSPQSRGGVGTPSVSSPAAARTINGLTPSARGGVVRAPGAGPEIPFTEDRWEFWWEFNHDALIDLRPTLNRQGAAVGGLGFTPVGADEKQQVVLPVLLRSMRDSNERVRASACYSLARLGHTNAVTYLKHAATDDSSLMVRTHAVIALGQTRSPRAVDTLQSILWDEHRPDEMRSFAAVSLGMLGTPASSLALREMMGTGEQASLPYTVRLAVVYGLGLTEDRANAPMLRQFAVRGTDDDRLRALVVLALGRVGDRAANAVLMDALCDKQTQVRRSAAIALGAVGQPADDQVHQALDQAANRDPDNMVRNFSDIALGRIAARGKVELVDTLCKRMLKETSGRRSFVVLALGIAGHDKVVPAMLQQFRKESSHSLAGALAVALALLDDDKAIPLLRQRFRSTGDPMLRGYLAYALGRLGDTEVKDELRQQLETENSPELLRWTAVAMANLSDPKIGEALQSISGPDREVTTRSTAAYGLGLVGDRKAIPLLCTMMNRPGEVDLVRAQAVYALGMLCDQIAEPTPTAYARDHNYTLNLPFVPELYFLF